MPRPLDDVVAETLLVLWRRLDDVPAEAELAWCYGTARRCLANTWRADERRNRLARRVASQPAPVDDAGAETDAELVAALDELSGDDREIVRLWAWEQLAPREIAVVLAISPIAASIRLHRAKQRLAARLGTRKDGATAGHNPAGDHVDEQRRVVGVIVANRDGSDEPIAAPVTFQLPGTGGPTMSSCLPVTDFTPDPTSQAFAGTVTAAEGNTVTLEVDQWYTGDADQPAEVVLAAGTDVPVALDGVDFVVGERYLVTTLAGEVLICGVSAPATPDLEALYAQWYGS